MFEQRLLELAEVMNDQPSSHGVISCEPTMRVNRESCTFLAAGRAAFLQVRTAVV